MPHNIKDIPMGFNEDGGEKVTVSWAGRRDYDVS